LQVTWSVIGAFAQNSIIACSEAVLRHRTRSLTANTRAEIAPSERPLLLPVGG
jgi:hypothetical protein